MTLDNLKDLYLEQLRDLYNAEGQLTSALSEMAGQASHNQLKTAFQEHLEQTRNHKKRLQQVFDDLGETSGGEKCEAMEGLIEEAKGLMKKDMKADVLDAALIASAQRVEHYEIAAYGTVCTYAEQLDRRDDHDLLGQTLEEEKETDGKLTRLAEQVVNPEAATA